MTAYVTTDRFGAYWHCTPCCRTCHGFVDAEDAQEAADRHNRAHHRGDNPDDDYWDRLREARHA